MSLKNCPFCGKVGCISKWPTSIGDARLAAQCIDSQCIMLGVTYVTESEAITAWNTRAAPTMKPWVWEVQRDEWFTCLIVEPTYKAKVTMCVGSSVWRAHVDGKYIGEFMFCDAAKNACKIFVERKLKEWLV